MKGQIYNITKNERDVLYEEKINLILSTEGGRTVIDGGRIRTDSITSGSIAAESIYGRHIISDAIKTGHLSADTVTADKIKSDAIIARHIQSDTIIARHIKAESIDASKIKAGEVILPDEKYGGVYINTTGLNMINTVNHIALSADKGLKIHNTLRGKTVFWANPTTGEIEMDVASLTIKSSDVYTQDNFNLGTINLFRGQPKNNPYGVTIDSGGYYNIYLFKNGYENPKLEPNTSYVFQWKADVIEAGNQPLHMSIGYGKNANEFTKDIKQIEISKGIMYFTTENKEYLDTNGYYLGIRLSRSGQPSTGSTVNYNDFTLTKGNIKQSWSPNPFDINTYGDVRNYLMGSDKNLLLENQTTNNSSSKTTNSLSINFQNKENFYRGKYLTISVDVEIKNGQYRIVNGVQNVGQSRVGYEMSISFKDGTLGYISAWKTLSYLGENYKKRITNLYYFPNKEIQSLGLGGIYIQMNGDYLYVSNPKITIGDYLENESANEWILAPEDSYTKEETESRFKFEKETIELGVKNSIKNSNPSGTNLLSGTQDFSQGRAGTLSIIADGNFMGNKILESSWVGSTPSATYSDIYTLKTDNNTNDEYYTASFWAKGNKSGIDMRAYLYQTNKVVFGENNQKQSTTTNDGAIKFTISDKWEKYWVTWKITPDNELKTIIIGRIFDKNAKIQLSSIMLVASSTPAEWGRSAKETSTIEDTDARIKLAKNEIEIGVKSTIDNINIGGRNYLRRTNDPSNIFLSSNDNSTIPMKVDILEEGTRKFYRTKRTSTSNGNKGFSLYSTIGLNLLTVAKAGLKNMIISFKARAPYEIEFYLMARKVGPDSNLPDNLKKVIVTNEWKTFYVTSEDLNATSLRVNLQNPVRPTDIIDLETFYVDMCEWKIEEGNMPTAWSPAPEDSYTSIETDAKIKVAKDIIDISIDSTNYRAMFPTGEMLFEDVNFEKGTNNMNLYNNANNGNLTYIRQEFAAGMTTPSGGARYQFRSIGVGSPNLGGFFQNNGNIGRPSAIYIHRFVANLPKGYIFNIHSNSLGNGGKSSWLGSNEGTSTWQTYEVLIQCGDGGSFGTFGHISVSGPTPTSGVPLLWYVAESTIVDITKASKYQTESKMKAYVQVETDKVTTGVNQKIGELNTSTRNIIMNSSANNETPYLLINGIKRSTPANATISYLPKGGVRVAGNSVAGTQKIFDIGSSDPAVAHAGLDKIGYSDISPGDTITFSAIITNENISAGVYVIIYEGYGSTGWRQNNSSTIVQIGETKISSVTVKVGLDAKSLLFRIYGGTAANGIFSFRNLMASKSSMPVDWVPSLKDTTTGAFNENILENSDFKNTMNAEVVTKNPDLYAVRWGGHNGGITNPTTNYHAHVDTDKFGFEVYKFDESDGTRHWKGIAQSLDNQDVVTLEKEGSLWFSLDSYIQGSALGETRLYGGMYYYNKSGAQGFHNGSYYIYPQILNEWDRTIVSVPFDYKNADLTKTINFYIYGYNFGVNNIAYIKNVKLEIGKYGTPYSKAVKDTVQMYEFNDVKQQIEPDRITQSVLSTQGFNDWNIDNMSTKADLADFEISQELLGQLDNQLNDSVEGVITRMASYETTNASFTWTLSQHADLLTEQGKVTADVSNNMTFTTKGLTIGRSTNTFKMNLSEKRLTFLNGTHKMSFFSGEKMFISNAQITESILFGNHLIERDTTNNQTIIRYFENPELEIPDDE